MSFASDKEAPLILISQVDQGTDFAAWLVQWDSHMNLSAMEKGLAKNQIQALTLCISHQTLTVVQNMGLTITSPLSYEPSSDMLMNTLKIVERKIRL